MWTGQLCERVKEKERIERRNAGTSKERKWGTDLCIADRQTIILAHETLLLSAVLHLILSLLRWVPSFVSWSLHRSPYHPLLYASFLIPQSSTESETGNEKYCNILRSKNGKHATKRNRRILEIHTMLANLLMVMVLDLPCIMCQEWERNWTFACNFPWTRSLHSIDQFFLFWMRIDKKSWKG